jgi:hypothetical protein
MEGIKVTVYSWTTSSVLTISSERQNKHAQTLLLASPMAAFEEKCHIQTDYENGGMISKDRAFKRKSDTYFRPGQIKLDNCRSKQCNYD